jgi:hypothetical protein
MIVVRMELWPGGDKARAEDLGIMQITNDETGTADEGNYMYLILKSPKYAQRPGIWRQGRIEGFPRRSRAAGPWDLLRGILNDALGPRWH